MKCPKCQRDNREGAKFCIECGESFTVSCPKCNKALPPAAKFCDECGHNLQAPKKSPDYSEPQSYTPKFLADKILTARRAIEGERKLVTVLFADVANYTSMSEKLDPEEVHQIMDGCFKILMDEIHQYEGTINQFTGDGVMALFGAPIAHEDHAQRACFASLSIQKAIEKYGEKLKNEGDIDFKMRIGLNSGPVIVGSIGDDLRMDYTAVGDTTNLAARMESLAKPGSVLVSANTYKITHDFFEFKSIGKIDVKGKKEPQEAFELIKKGEVDSRIGASVAKGLTMFVGRKYSIAALMEAYEKVQSGSGQVVGIVGEAGIGKSRLILEFHKKLPPNETAWLEGRCIHYGGSMAYLPILEILRSYFDIQDGDREFIIKKKLEDKILRLDERLKNTLSPFQELLSVKVDNEAYLQLEPTVKKLRKFEAIRDLLIRESENQALVVIVDDLHWMDKTSGDFIKYLIDSLPHSRILLLLLYRPEYTHQWGSKSYYTKIGLDQLSTTSGAELVQAILENGEAVPELRDLVLSKAGGNPLFVEEIAHSLIENGFIVKKNQAYVLTKKASEIEVPDTIAGIISARLDRVEENLKRIMQVASVIGREFAFRILQSITGMKEDLKSCLLNLQGLEFIYEKQLFPELEYIFKHALTQEVAYGSLLLKRKKEIHEKIGHVIEELYAERLEEYYDVLAYHYKRSDNKEKAFVYLDLANRKAFNASAMEDAKGYFYKAMQILDTMPDTAENKERRISLLVNQFFVFEQLLQALEYYDLLIRYEPLATEIDNIGLAGGIYTRKGACELLFGFYDKAIQSETKTIKLCEASGNTEYAGNAFNIIRLSHLLKGDFEQVFTLKEDALRLMSEHFNLLVYVRSFMASSWAYAFCGRWDKAVAEGHHALKKAQEYSDDGQISSAASALSLVYILKGDTSRAIQYGEMSVKKSPAPGYKAWTQCNLAWAWCRAGEPYKGIETLNMFIPVFRAGRFAFFEILFSSCLAEGYFLAEADDKAEQSAKEALEVAERCGAKYYIGWAHRLLGEVALKTDYSKALPHFKKSISIFKKIKAENELALSYAGLGRLAKKQGDTVQAREHLSKALEIFERLGTLIEPDKVKKELADLPTEKG